MRIVSLRLALRCDPVRMRQILSGYLAWNDEHGSHVVAFKTNPKLDRLRPTQRRRTQRIHARPLEIRKV